MTDKQFCLLFKTKDSFSMATFTKDWWSCQGCVLDNLMPSGQLEMEGLSRPGGALRPWAAQACLQAGGNGEVFPYQHIVAGISPAQGSADGERFEMKSSAGTRQMQHAPSSFLCFHKLCPNRWFAKVKVQVLPE